MVITFPHMGNTYVTAKALLDDLGREYVIPPFNVKQSLEIGTK
jgi:predicted nucleotide-binding protein (sugar kinase/HSP70/actin superfamily)